MRVKSIVAVFYHMLMREQIFKSLREIISMWEFEQI